MFLAHRVDVTKALEADGEHILEIDFDCAMLRARELRSQNPKHKWASFNGDPARMSVRKAQYHWGWDWGPVLMTAGIWRDVKLEVYTARIADLWTEVQLAADHQEATVSAFMEVDGATSPYWANFKLSLSGQEIASEETTVDKGNTAKVTFNIKNPSLWWPHGYGDPTLYELSASLTDKRSEFHHISKKVGIRTAEVVQQPDKHGKSFFFRINGVDVFCGGSCWIPADSILTTITPERYRKWVESMVAGHQVMTRFVPSHISLLRLMIDILIESGAAEFTKTTASTPPATNSGSWSGKTSCSPAGTTQPGLAYSTQSEKKQSITSADCVTTRQ